MQACRRTSRRRSRKISAPQQGRNREVLKVVNNCRKTVFLSYFLVLPAMSYRSTVLVMHMKKEETAGEGNRTLVCSLGSCRSTIELHPRTAEPITDFRVIVRPFRVASGAGRYPSPHARS